MLYLMCTESVQRAVGLSKASFCEAEDTDHPLGNWYCNRVVVDRKPLYLFMSDKTLLSFFQLEEHPVSAARLAGLFAVGLEGILELIGVDAARIESLLLGYQEGRLAKSRSRSDLGSLRDLAACLQHHALHEGGLHLCDLEDTMVKINQMPQRRLHWQSAAEASKAAVSPAA